MLDENDERRSMSDKEILEMCIDLEKSFLSELKRIEVMAMLYKYKDTFSLRY